MAISYTQYIDGNWRHGSGGHVQQVLDPATGQSNGELVHASTSDVDDAVAAAVAGFSTWRRVPAIERARILRKAADLMRAQREEIGRVITLELGKPLKEAVAEVVTAAEMFEWAAEECRRLYGRSIPARGAGILQLAQYEPIGPVAAFAGWNAPAITPSRKISGALAAGCSIVIKPSEETPGVALAIARALADAGVPPGVVNLVFGDPAQVADQLLAAPGIRMVTFTGATSVGRQIGEKAASSMKRATLELGGHAPVIVMDSVDVERVARSAVATKYRNAGQVCTSPTRFYVHERIYSQFTEVFSEAARSLRVGPGIEEGTQMGPLKNQRRREAIERLVEDARDRGVRVVTGGRSIQGPGFFFEPTVLADFHNDCRAAAEEPFGPLALLRPFSNVEEAVTEANRLPCGLASYVFTRDLLQAQHFAEAIESGVVCVNEWCSWRPLRQSAIIHRPSCRP
jgi:succinate-semialdehyde dehydrogenase/glutarate-semialdehyde dehydrogenase